MLRTACQPDLLSAALAERLSEQQEEQLSQHLSECAACREQLERLAGGQEEWQSVQIALRRTPHPDTAGDATSAVPARSEWAVDFAVNFLKPSPRGDALGRLDDIDILGVIGAGGMGIVLKGFQTELNRPVAVKVLAPHLATSGAARQRFAREAQAAAAIMHPNVMPILAVNSSGALPYLVMPFVACESLQQRLDHDGHLPTVDVLRIGLQMARGLAAAHAQGLIHRDVKPANILLEKGLNRALLTDFGLARAADDASLTRSGVIAGTPQFMSPEQARGESIDPRSDLFSLGSVLYTLCAGRAPFRAETSYGILRRVTDEMPRSLREIHPEVPDWLETIVQRLHAKRAEDRPASADVVADLLEQCLAHVEQPNVAPLPTELTSQSPHTRLGRMVLVAGVATLLATAVALGVLFLRGPEPTAKDSSEQERPGNVASVGGPDVTTGGAQGGAAASDFARWDDGLETQIEEAGREAEALRQRIEADWE
ncbi:MAG: protein kinase [Planctomycetaceae bacterium]|nr:protein kinase [Planctomycetaceae bacterium]